MIFFQTMSLVVVDSDKRGSFCSKSKVKSEKNTRKKNKILEFEESIISTYEKVQKRIKYFSTWKNALDKGDRAGWEVKLFSICSTDRDVLAVWFEKKDFLCVVCCVTGSFSCRVVRS